MAEKVRFEIDSQGCRLFGKIYMPADFSDSRKYPVVIISHGFGSCMRDVRPYADVFLECGYIAVVFDFCMSGIRCRSTGKTTDMSVLTQKQDLLNVISYVRELPYADSSSIVLAGCSQGGFVSALAAAEREDDVHKLILYYPALCIPDDLRNGRVHTARYDVSSPPETIRALYLKLGKKYILDARDLDPYEQICAFGKPVLIVHGIEDELVPVSFSRKAAENYPDCELVEVHGDHGFVRRGFDDAQKAVKRFIQPLE